MFIDSNNKRINIHATYTDADGTRHDLTNPVVRAALGITEIPDPERKDPRFYFVTETDDAPYVVNTPRPIGSVKDDICQQIRDHRDTLMLEGGVLVEGSWFHSDTHSKLQQLALVNLGANLPEGLQWKTMDGSFVTMTPQLAIDIFLAQVAQEQAVFAKSEAEQAAVNALTSVDDIAAYDWKQGWPETYTETDDEEEDA
jgi:hypothetical protein